MSPKLALLHGFTSGPEAFDELRGLLRGGADALAPALVGHGAAVAAASSTFEDEVDRLAEMLRAAGAPLHLVGYSLGGRLALGLLVRHPQLFVRATLVGAQPGLPTEAERRERREADERWCALLEERGVEAFVDAWERLPLFATQAALPDAVRAAQRAARLRGSAAGLARSLRATGLGVMPSHRGALASIPVPTTLVAGALDEKFARIAAEMAAAWPTARVHLVAGAGHNVVLEQPAALARLLDEGQP